MCGSNDEITKKPEKRLDAEVQERTYCLGDECPDKNCRICPASWNARFVLDVTDSYRQSVPKGYYTTTVMSYKDPVTGEEKFCYTRPE